MYNLENFQNIIQNFSDLFIYLCISFNRYVLRLCNNARVPTLCKTDTLNRLKSDYDNLVSE